MSTTLQDFLSKTGSLPSFPVVFHEIKAECENPRSTIDSIGAILLKDPGLASRILKLANSAFYGFPKRIETIPQALGKIGLAQLQNLVIATTVIESFQKISPALVDVRQFWKHCISTGVCSAFLASEVNDGNPERLFVAGLLHDIGRLVFYLKAPESIQGLLTRSLQDRILETNIEKEFFGFDHAELGGALLQHWNLPPVLVEAVRCHHHPDQAFLAPRDAAITHVADIFTSALQIGSSGEYFVPAFSPAAWDKSELEPESLDQLLLMVDNQTEQLFGILV